ncbi:MAG: hypothetical protein BWK76_14055 [Desulfobulbaceae bacterium A2]|nr:MAG: hypothetical protein BWK76_14055 [Desulfobulbaceae bacterium A2]
MRGRGRSRWDDYYPPYVSVAEKKAKAEAARKKLAASSRGLLEPVIIDGRAIVVTWWGKSWCANLERYADYDNRLPRGRSYVRSGAVLDLKIEAGRITAQVSGSHAKPYTVQIELAPLAPARAERLREQCRASLDSLSALLAGHFPDELREALFTQDSGLFPAPKELKFQCSCPDWASMCKHVAATLYGVGARLDERPALFFTLRGLKVDDFVGQVVREESERLLSRADTVSERVITTADDELASLFGITLEDTRTTAAGAGAGTQAVPRRQRGTAREAKATPSTSPAGATTTRASRPAKAAATTTPGKGRRNVPPAPSAPADPPSSATASPPRKRGRPAKVTPPAAGTQPAASVDMPPAKRRRGKRAPTASGTSPAVTESPLTECSLDDQLLAAFEQARQRSALSGAQQHQREGTNPPKRGRALKPKTTD